MTEDDSCGCRCCRMNAGRPDASLSAETSEVPKNCCPSLCICNVLMIKNKPVCYNNNHTSVNTTQERAGQLRHNPSCFACLSWLCSRCCAYLLSPLRLPSPHLPLLHTGASCSCAHSHYSACQYVVNLSFHMRVGGRGG